MENGSTAVYEKCYLKGRDVFMNLHKFNLLSFVMVLFAANGSVGAKTLNLNDSRVYDFTAVNYEVGDTIQIGEETFRPQKLIGQGNSTYVFDIGNKVLRIPKRKVFDYMLQDNMKGCQIFSQNSHRRFFAKCYETRSPMGYALSEKINVKFLMSDFLENPEDLIAKGKITRAQIPEINAKLLELVDELAIYSVISDLAPRQIAWDGTKFVLLDWMEPIEVASAMSTTNSVDTILPFVKDPEFKGEIWSRAMASLGRHLRRQIRTGGARQSLAAKVSDIMSPASALLPPSADLAQPQ